MPELKSHDYHHRGSATAIDVLFLLSHFVTVEIPLRWHRCGVVVPERLWSDGGIVSTNALEGHSTSKCQMSVGSGGKLGGECRSHTAASLTALRSQTQGALNRA